MRRENSKFNAAFLSNEGSKIFNNDYYGSAELDRYACYVAADGLEPGDIDSYSAQIAVQAAIAAFHERPSLKKGALRKYIQASHTALKSNSGHLSLRASITIVVTDYQKIRYSWAGNTRFYLYRAGRLKVESTDHSLSRQMVDRSELPIDKIASHEERDNLSRYAGQPGALAPQVSRKIKLQNGDIIVLITRGIWEKCDTADIRAALDSSENHPLIALGGIERLLLDPHPEEVDNYTASAVFVDKVLIDPNRSKRVKRTLMVAIPTLVILIGLAVALIVLNNIKQSKIQNMNAAFLSGLEYIADDDFYRAADDLERSLKLAGEVKDLEFSAEAELYKRLVDAVTNGDELFAAGRHADALEAYLAAQDRSRFTGKYGEAYIMRKLALTSDFLSVREWIALGDTLVDIRDFDQARIIYGRAKLLASRINDADGRRLADEAVLYLHEEEARTNAEKRIEDERRAEILQQAIDAEIAGEKSYSDGDIEGAKVSYSIAHRRYVELDDSASVERIDLILERLENIRATKAQEQAQRDVDEAQIEEQRAIAAGLIADGDDRYFSGDYDKARAKYIEAHRIYSSLQDSINRDYTQKMIDMCDLRIREMENSRQQGAPPPEHLPPEGTNPADE